MSNVEIKARQLLDRYGKEMAAMQVRFFLESANGAMRRWWQQVLACIAATEAVG